MAVTLRELTRENWRECIKLTPAEDQVEFVAPNLFSIAQSRFNPSWVPLAIYSDEAMVGFLMYGVDESDGSYWVIRLMVDKEQQGKGYGRAAMLEVIERLRAEPRCSAIMISFVPENRVAERLYESLGFHKTGLIEDGEVVMRLELAELDGTGNRDA